MIMSQQLRETRQQLYQIMKLKEITEQQLKETRKQKEQAEQKLQDTRKQKEQAEQQLHDIKQKIDSHPIAQTENFMAYSTISTPEIRVFTITSD